MSSTVAHFSQSLSLIIVNSETFGSHHADRALNPYPERRGSRENRPPTASFFSLDRAELQSSLLQKNLRVFTVLLGLAAVLPGQTANPTVRFHTNVGDIDVRLTPAAAPKTVANFLSYLSAGAYSNSIFHRDVQGFIIQGGGFQLQNHVPVATAKRASR
jgi:hypothetical protein